MKTTNKCINIGDTLEFTDYPVMSDPRRVHATVIAKIRRSTVRVRRHDTGLEYETTLHHFDRKVQGVAQ